MKLKKVGLGILLFSVVLAVGCSNTADDKSKNSTKKDQSGKNLADEQV